MPNDTPLARNCTLATVPSVSAAVAALQAAGLKVSLTTSKVVSTVAGGTKPNPAIGQVLSQSPAAGASVKTGIRAATGDYILIVDADGQHQADDALRLIARLGEYDLVVGARSGDMHAGQRRRLGNNALNWLAGFLTGREIPDLTSGLRAATRDGLREFLPLLPNGFSTPTTTTMAFIKAGYNVAFEPISAKPRIGTSKIHLARDGGKFVLIMVRVMTIFSPLRVFLPIAGVSFALGAGYAAWTIATQEHITNSSVLLIVLAVLLFGLGLISEQIATLRFDGRK